MVETLAPAGYAGRLRTTIVACATFALGALAGGAITFGGLALLGSALGRRRAGARRARRTGGRGRGSARRADRAAGAAPGAGVVATQDAAAARCRALRRPARARLHDVHPLVRRLGAGGNERGARRSGARARGRARVRRRPCAAGDRARAVGRRAPRRGDGPAPAHPALAAGDRRGGARGVRDRAVGRTSPGARSDGSDRPRGASVDRRRRRVGPERRRAHARVQSLRRTGAYCVLPPGTRRRRAHIRRSAAAGSRTSAARPSRSPASVRSRPQA